MDSVDSQITFCYTDNLEETARFYEEILEFNLALVQAHCRIYKTAEKAYIGFCQRCDAAKPDGVILTLVTRTDEEVDKLIKKYSEKGVRFDTKPEFNPTYNIYHFFLTDPNGYKIEVQCFRDTDWDQAD